MTSVIHDIGYRHYDGPRLGRAYAVRSLFVHNLRAAYGLGRPGKTKIMPFTLFAMMLLPVGDQRRDHGVRQLGTADTPVPLIRYSAYAIYLQPLIAIFLAAQAPVLASRDLRFHVTPLYFSRPLSRMDYVLAKYGALVAALLILHGHAADRSCSPARSPPSRSTSATHTAALLRRARGLPDLRAGARRARPGRRGLHAAPRVRRHRGHGRLPDQHARRSRPSRASRRARREFGVARWAGLFTPFDLVDGVQVWALRAKRSARRTPAGRPRRPGVHARVRGRRRRRAGDPAPAVPQGGRPVTVSTSDQEARERPRTRDVSRWYGNVVAVNGITMTVGPGVTGLLGPNGAGKSTLIHMMGGFLPPSSGQVGIDGRQIWKNPSVYRDIGLVPEREAAYDFLTGRQFVRSMAKLHKLPEPGAAAERALAMVEMTAARRPRHRHLLQGHEAARQDGLRARPRPAGAAARRAVQRHGPAPAAPADGPDPQAWPPRAVRCCSARTSSKRSSGSRTTSRSSSRAATRPPATSARSAG